ncbi:MAG: hypothetical protein RLZZ440_691 [Planctomycetota bacterium]|jgi:hypothetical protein
MKALRWIAGVLALSILCSASRSEASIVVEWSNQGGGLVGSWTGSFDTTGYTSSSTSTAADGGMGASPSGPSVFAFTSHASGVTLDVYVPSPQKLSIGGGIFSIATLSGGTVAGDSIGFQTTDAVTPLTEVFLPQGYTSGSTLSGSVTLAGSLFSTVFGSNLDSPKVMFNDGTNTVTFQTAVPEPSTVALLAGGVIAAAGAALRRQARFVVTWLTVAVRGCGCRSRAEWRRAG